MAGAFRAAASVHPDPTHKTALEGHAETLSKVDVADAARAAYAARDKSLIQAVGIFIAAQGNPEAQAAWDQIMDEDAKAATAAKEGE